MNGQEAAEAAAPTGAVRHLRRLREAVRLHRRQVGAGDLHVVRRDRSAGLTCSREEAVAALIAARAVHKSAS